MELEIAGRGALLILACGTCMKEVLTTTFPIALLELITGWGWEGGAFCHILSLNTTKDGVRSRRGMLLKIDVVKEKFTSYHLYRCFIHHDRLLSLN